jgi:copper chaperone CopZ
MTEEIVISDMNCKHCKMKIEAAASAVEAVRSAIADLDRKTLVVELDSPSDAEAVREAVRSAGYTPD